MVRVIHMPPNNGPIDEVFVWLSVDATGEGVVAGKLPNGSWVPLVTGSRQVAEMMRPYAEEAGRSSGKEIRLAHYLRVKGGEQ